LKQTLNSIEGLVNKAVKKQLDSFHMRLQRNEEPGIKTENQEMEPEGNEDEADCRNRGTEEDHHVCRICWQYFVNGHQLGGHMSKKHPGHSLEYRNKELIKTRKVIERERRLYFRAIQKSAIQSRQSKVVLRRGRKA
jgi:hypothetical protein